MSFHTWSIFSESLRRDTPDLFLYYFTSTISEPKSSLDVYTAPLASNPLSFITSLSITVACPVPDLVRLSDVSNLAVLEIIHWKMDSDRALGLGDRLVRAWYLAALNGAFPVLRILRMWDFKNLTERSLSFLNAFPALSLYDVRGCGFDNISSLPPVLGWTPIPKSNFSSDLMKACKENILAWSRLGNIGAELEQSNAEDANSQQSKPPQSFDWESIAFISRAEVPNSLNQLDFIPRSMTIPDTWDDMTYRLSPLVGAARNDTDLTRAGFNIGDPLAIGKKLGSSIPTVSLRVGQYQYQYPRHRSRCIAYIRNDLTYSLTANICEGGHKVVEERREYMHGETTKCERQGQGVMQTKKRKLNDLLNSLL